LAKRFLSRLPQAGGKIIQPNCAGAIVKVARSGTLFISRGVEERQTPKSCGSPVITRWDNGRDRRKSTHHSELVLGLLEVVAILELMVLLIPNYLLQAYREPLQIFICVEQGLVQLKAKRTITLANFIWHRDFSDYSHTRNHSCRTFYESTTRFPRIVITNLVTITLQRYIRVTKFQRGARKRIRTVKLCRCSGLMRSPRLLGIWFGPGSHS